jgi:hypothetical protein
VPTSSTAETFRNQPLLTVEERPVQDWMPIVARDASVVPQRTASLVAMDRTGVVMEAVRAEPVKVNGIVQPRSQPAAAFLKRNWIVRLVADWGHD